MAITLFVQYYCVGCKKLRLPDEMYREAKYPDHVTRLCKDCKKYEHMYFKKED